MDTQRHSNGQDRTTTRSSRIRQYFYRSLRIICGVYIGLVLLAIVFETDLVYHGTPTDSAYHHPGCEEHFIRSRDGVLLHAISVDFPLSDKWALFFHGNAGSLKHRVGFLKELSFELKRDVMAVDYRGFGKSEGMPSEGVLISDAEEFIHYAKEQLGLRTEQCYIVGRSLGGGVAMQLATKHDFEAMILINTFTSLPDVASELYPFLPTHQIMRNRFDSLLVANRIKVPVFQTHGTLDEIIPYQNGRTLHEGLNSPKAFWLHQNASHNTALPPEFFRAFNRFIDAL